MLLAAPLGAARLHRGRSGPLRQAPGISLRKRLHVNNLIAEPGTLELDFGGLYSYTTGGVTFPSALKFTPAGGSLLWGATEYSVAFDSLASTVNTGSRATQFSDRLTFAATSVAFDSPFFDIAIAPQVTVFLRDESGARVGATLIARYDRRNHTVAATAGWTAAVSTSAASPAGVWDFGGAYGHTLASEGLLKRFTPHVNAVLEKATGFEGTLALFGGIEYQLRPRLAIDASAQRLSLSGTFPDRQFLLSLTLNLGKLQ